MKFKLILCLFIICLIGCANKAQNIKNIDDIISEIDNADQATAGREISSSQVGDISQIVTPQTGLRKNEANITFKDGRISCNVINADLRNILAKISELANINIVFGDNIYGRVNAKFDSQNIDDSLNLLLNSTNYTLSKTGDVYSISKSSNMPTSYIKYHEIRLEHVIAEKLLERIASVYGIPYSSSGPNTSNINSEADLELKPYAGPSNLVMSGINIIKAIDSNVLIISGEEKKVEEILELISILDQKTPQILIETYLVEYDENALKESGIELSANVVKTIFNLAFAGGFARSSMFRMPSLVDATRFWKDKSTDNSQNTDGTDDGSDIFHSLQVDETETKQTNINTKIQALIDKNNLRVLSKPYIVVSNNSQAIISSASEQYIVAEVIGDANRLMEKAETKTSFRIIPNVISENTIQVQLSLEQSEFTTPQPNAALGTNKNTAQTSLVVADGETIVIGGINSKREVTTSRGIPYLMNIPILKYIFGVRSKTTISRKVNFYVTPYILPLKGGITKEEME